MGLKLWLAVLCFAALAGLVACEPLYGGKPEKLHNPEKKKKPDDPTNGEPVIKYVEGCTASFQDDPKKAHPNPTLSRQITDTGDTAMASADKAPEVNAKVGLLREAIDKYRNALIKDPYNPDATLKLAIAYDRVLRKDCAIAMLKRLAALTTNARFAPEANRNIDAVGDNAQWFKGYRKDAMSAVGR